MSDKSPPPQKWLEARRFRALELKEKGWKQKEIAEALGVSQGAVSQWMHRVKTGGAENLRHIAPPGAPPRMSAAQKEQLVKMLKKGAEAFGFTGQIWTGPRVARLIKSHFGIGYHQNHVPRLLKALGFSVQKPVKKARQQDEEKVASFKETTLPQIKKKSK